MFLFMISETELPKEIEDELSQELSHLLEKGVKELSFAVRCCVYGGFEQAEQHIGRYQNLMKEYSNQEEELQREYMAIHSIEE